MLRFVTAYPPSMSCLWTCGVDCSRDIAGKHPLRSRFTATRPDFRGCVQRLQLMLGWREECAVMLAKSLSSAGPSKQLTLQLACWPTRAMLQSLKILATSALAPLSKLPG